MCVIQSLESLSIPSVAIEDTSSGLKSIHNIGHIASGLGGTTLANQTIEFVTIEFSKAPLCDHYSQLMVYHQHVCFEPQRKRKRGAIVCGYH